MGKLDGRIAIVTGAGRGIGFGIAQRLCSAGAEVVIAEINPSLGQEAVRNLSEHGYRATFHETDVGKHESVGALVDAVASHFGRLDILVNNAGLGQVGPTETYPIAEWNRQIQVMLSGVFLCIQAAGRVMLRQRKGVILNIASIGGLGAWPMRSAYNSAKAGVIPYAEQAVGVP